jgi:hypothetical protein
MPTGTRVAVLLNPAMPVHHVALKYVLFVRIRFVRGHNTRTSYAALSEF